MPASKSRCFRLFVEALITIIFFDGLFVTVVGLAIGSRPIIPQLVLYFGLMAGSSAMALVGGIHSAAQGQQDAVYYWQTGLCILRVLHFMLGAALLLRIAHEQEPMSAILVFGVVFVVILLIVVFVSIASMHVSLYNDVTTVAGGRKIHGFQVCPDYDQLKGGHPELEPEPEDTRVLFEDNSSDNVV